ncbi:hypothetical protein AbraIFM66951_006760 [Aspergillus brasiliensis]|uniref:F-box domain-containing protein n=1 Tax=Aspergillus brasiliensis TaxID=319629 RepID=A0A9W5Z2Z4_9EURO|nr:hypothetical protein AbraCBS73388_005328 [Aspergillus brasiliensis]GKZ51701.1 hypothetical protein AbraIFM66951_006760 [Aspergillus brasiliensis]
MANLNYLPTELLQEILSYIDYDVDLAALSQTTPRVYNLTSNLLDQRILHIHDHSHMFAYKGRAMYNAAFDGNEHCARRLLQAGITPAWKPNYFDSPIGIAAYKGHANLVRLFIEHGADPNYMTGKDNYSIVKSPLMNAIEGGHEEVVRVLLEHGVDLVYTKDKGTYAQPLSRAISYQRYEIAKLLLEHGCNPRTPNFSNLEESAFTEAGGRSLPILRLFVGPEISGDYFSASDEAARDMVVKALRMRDLPLVKFLLDHGAKLDSATWYENRPFDFLLSYDHLYLIGRLSGEDPEGARFLLRKIDVDNIITERNIPAAMRLARGAAHGGNVGLLKRLVDVNWGDAHPKLEPVDWTDHLTLCLVEAVPGGHLKVARLLLDLGAHPDGRTHGRQFHNYEWPIHKAIESGYTKLVELLLDRGANPFPRERKTAFEKATERYAYQLKPQARFDIIQLLVNRNLVEADKFRGKINLIDPTVAYERRTIERAVRWGAKIFDLVRQHFDIKLEVGNEHHQAAFVKAVETGDTAIMKEFLEAGFNPNVPKHLLLTAANHICDRVPTEEPVDLLLMYGAWLELKDGKPKMPCVYRAMRAPAYCPDTAVKLLLRKGADPFSVDKSGKYWFVQVAEQGDVTTVQGVLGYFDEEGIPFTRVKSMVEKAARAARSAAEVEAALAYAVKPEDFSRNHALFGRSRDIAIVAENLWRWYWRKVYPCPES